jgi:hypothetical protein
VIKYQRFWAKKLFVKTRNIRSMIGQIVTEFYQIFQHLSFSKQNLVNPEPIE